jgi:lipoprotein signal peptidase
VFNIADVFINLGIVCLLIAAFRPSAPSTNNAKRSRRDQDH